MLNVVIKQYWHFIVCQFVSRDKQALNIIVCEADLCILMLDVS